MDTQTTETSGNGQPPTLAVAGQTKTRCTCGQEDYWPIVADEYHCTACGELTTVVATTGHTADEAIARAAQALPERVEPIGPAQPSIPGLRPAFDVAAALDSIEQAERDASAAERAYGSAKTRAKQLRDDADKKNATLRELIRALNDRRHDDRYERPADGSEVEREDESPAAPSVGTTVAPTVGDDSPAGVSALDDLGTRVARLIADATRERYPSATDLRDLITDVTGIHLLREEVEPWPLQELGPVCAWLQRCAQARATGDDPLAINRPTLLGHPHVIGMADGSCSVCGTFLHPLAATHGLERWPVGALVGTDCVDPRDPEEPEEMAPAAVRVLLAKAGADISVEQVVGWSQAQRLDAQTWAIAQIEANRRAESGNTISVRWPEHVSQAHHGNDVARTPTRRHASLVARAKAKQAKPLKRKGR